MNHCLFICNEKMKSSQWNKKAWVGETRWRDSSTQRDTERRHRVKQREKANSMSQQSEDDTERRSAVSNSRFHDNSRWQGPRPHALSVMNHLPWRWGNTHKCTHMCMQRLTRSRVLLSWQIAFIEGLFTSGTREVRKKTHILVYIKRIVFQPQPAE